MTTILAHSDDPRDNAKKIAALLTETGDSDYADLYRTILSGPSGQTARLLVGRIRHLPWGPYEFRIIDMGLSAPEPLAGFARRHLGEWLITREAPDGALSLIGFASSLSIGVDVLINGEHAALGRHDARRTSSGTFRPPARAA